MTTELVHTHLEEARVRREGLLKRSTSDLPTSRDVTRRASWRCFSSSARVKHLPDFIQASHLQASASPVS